MATAAQRRLQPKEIRRFGSLRPPYLIPDLTEIQTRSYEAFLQYDVPGPKRWTAPEGRVTSKDTGESENWAANRPSRDFGEAPAGAAPVFRFRSSVAVSCEAIDPPVAMIR